MRKRNDHLHFNNFLWTVDSREDIDMKHPSPAYNQIWRTEATASHGQEPFLDLDDVRFGI